MVQRRVDAVDTNSIDTELLKEWKITLAGLPQCEGVDEVGGFTKGIVIRCNNNTYIPRVKRAQYRAKVSPRTLLLVCNSLDVEPGTRLVVEELSCTGDFGKSLHAGCYKATKEGEEHWGSQ